jgi:hypothetical protein
VWAARSHRSEYMSGTRAIDTLRVSASRSGYQLIQNDSCLQPAAGGPNGNIRHGAVLLFSGMNPMHREGFNGWCDGEEVCTATRCWFWP